MARTFRFQRIALDELSASDLRDEAERQPDARAYVATVYDEQGDERAESIQALMLRPERRVGIAWGADAEWGDLATLTDGEIEQCIHEYLNDDDAWAARN